MWARPCSSYPSFYWHKSRLAVDGDDFLKWQRGESPLPSSAIDLTDWKRHYGAFQPPSTLVTIVPEPSSEFSLLLASIA